MPGQFIEFTVATFDLDRENLEMNEASVQKICLHSSVIVAVLPPVSFFFMPQVDRDDYVHGARVRYIRPGHDGERIVEDIHVRESYAEIVASLVKGGA